MPSKQETIERAKIKKDKMQQIRASYRDIVKTPAMEHHLKWLKESEDHLIKIAQERSIGTEQSMVIDADLALSMVQRAAALKQAREQIERLAKT